MHIPTVTDQMLDKVLEKAVAPVAVLFHSGDETLCRREFVLHRFKQAADQFDDRVIFLKISCDENPTPAERFTKPWQTLEMVIFRRGAVVGRMHESFSSGEIAGLLEICLRQGVE